MVPAGLVSKRRKCIAKLSKPTGGWLCLGAHVITVRYINSRPLNLNITSEATIPEYIFGSSPQHKPCHMLLSPLAIYRYPMTCTNHPKYMTWEICSCCVPRYCVHRHTTCTMPQLKRASRSCSDPEAAVSCLATMQARAKQEHSARQHLLPPVVQELFT